MQHLQTLNLLIDHAKKNAGSDSAVAKAIGVPIQHVSNWRHGRRTATPEDQALLAAVAGLDPVAEMARAMVAKYEGTPKGDKLMRALGKALPVIGAAIGSAGVAVVVTSSNRQDLIDTMYIM